MMNSHFYRLFVVLTQWTNNSYTKACLSYMQTSLGGGELAAQSTSAGYSLGHTPLHGDTQFTGTS